MRDFGVIVVCHRGDYYLAKACCASIRYFMDDVPIALIADGDFPTHELEATYSVRVIRRDDIDDVDLRSRSFGWGLTKMLAFWFSPWESFLVLDADVVVVGDVRRYAEMAGMVVDCHLEQMFPPSPLVDLFLGRHRLIQEPSFLAHIERWFFRPSLIRRHYPSFRLEQSIDRLFCSGCFFAKRGIIHRDDYVAVLDVAEAESGIFGPGEMGLLNFLVFRAEAAGDLSLAREPDLQTMAYMLSDEDAATRFPWRNGEPPREIDRPGTLHWSGWPKPLIDDTRPHAAVVNFFRRKFLFDYGCDGPRATAILAAEDNERILRFRNGLLTDADRGPGR